MNCNHNLMHWHQSQGGFAGHPAGHALRLLREVIELCIASGAQDTAITDAVFAELKKAHQKNEFSSTPSPKAMHEEFADCEMLMEVFHGYFMHPVMAQNVKESKFHVNQGRLWQVDRDGVLWRPGTNPSAPEVLGVWKPVIPPESGKSS